MVSLHVNEFIRLAALHPSTLILEVENGAKVWVDGVEAIVQFVGRKGLDLKTVRGEVLYGVAADTVRNDSTALLVY